MKTMLGLILVVLILAGAVSAQTPPATPAMTAAASANPINRQALEERMQTLQQGLEQAKANVQAFGGAIQDCQYWLGQLDAVEKKAAESKADKKDVAPKPLEPAKKEGR